MTLVLALDVLQVRQQQLHPADQQELCREQAHQRGPEAHRRGHHRHRVGHRASGHSLHLPPPHAHTQVGRPRPDRGHEGGGQVRRHQPHEHLLHLQEQLGDPPPALQAARALRQEEAAVQVDKETKTDSFVLVYHVNISFRRHSLFSMLPIDDDEDLHLEEASDNNVTSIKDYKYKTKTPSTIALPANISTEGSVISLLVLLRNNSRSAKHTV